MDMARVRCLFAARSGFDSEALPILFGLPGVALSRRSGRHDETGKSDVQEDVGVKNLLFGWFCRLRVRACQCAAGIAPSCPVRPEKSPLLLVWLHDCSRMLFHVALENFQNLFVGRHRIALAPIIIAQPARIQIQRSFA